MIDGILTAINSTLRPGEDLSNSIAVVSRRVLCVNLVVDLFHFLFGDYLDHFESGCVLTLVLFFRFN